METADDRAAIREQSLATHGLSSADLFDRRRPSRFTAEKTRRREAISTPSAEDVWLAGPPRDDESIPYYLGALTPRQRQVIMLRFGWGNPPANHTQEEVAEILQIDQSVVSRIEAAARARLAEHLGDPQQLNAVL